MSEFMEGVQRSVEEQHADRPAATRRQVVAGAVATLGGMGMLGLAQKAWAQGGGALPNSSRNDPPNTPENIVNIAATAEVLATIVNTVGAERVNLDAATKANIEAAAREELIHYQVLTSSAVGAKPVTKRIWVPDEVFSSASGLLGTLVVATRSSSTPTCSRPRCSPARGT